MMIHPPSPSQMPQAPNPIEMLLRTMAAQSHMNKDKIDQERGEIARDMEKFGVSEHAENRKRQLEKSDLENEVIRHDMLFKDQSLEENKKTGESTRRHHDIESDLLPQKLANEVASQKALETYYKGLINNKDEMAALKKLAADKSGSSSVANPVEREMNQMLELVHSGEMTDDKLKMLVRMAQGAKNKTAATKYARTTTDALDAIVGSAIALSDNEILKKMAEGSIKPAAGAGRKNDDSGFPQL